MPIPKLDLSALFGTHDFQRVTQSEHAALGWSRVVSAP